MAASPWGPRAASSSLVLLGLLGCALLAPVAHGSVHEYHGERFTTYGDAKIFRGGREGLYQSRLEYLEESEEYYYDYDFGSVFLAPGVANGESYIRLDTISVQRSRADAMKVADSKIWEVTGRLDIVVFELDQRDMIGAPGAGGHGWQYCCSPEVEEQYGCSPGEAIIRQEDGIDFPWVTTMTFWGNSTEATERFDEGVVIPESGMYYMWIISCNDPQPALKAYGKTIWKNPGGYLPGMLRPFLKFCGVMSILYVVGAIAWGVTCFVNRDTLYALQHCITAVIAMSAIESIMWYYDLVNFNSTGKRPLGITLIAVLFGCVRKTFARVLLLLVCMGYGTMRPTLGSIRKRIVALGSFYMLAILIYDVCANVGRVSDLSSIEKLVLVFPAAMLDALIVLTIFTGLSRTLAQLQLKKAEAKLEQYKSFTNALATGVWVSIAWLGYEAYFRVSDYDNSKWEREWVCNAFWYVLNFVMLGVVAFLWRPSKSFMRFAYSADDSELATLPTSQRPAVAAASSSKPSVNTDVFALDDELMEASGKEN